MDLARRIVFFGHSGDEAFTFFALDPAQWLHALPLEERERRARADIAHPTRYDQGFEGETPGLRLQRLTPS